MSFTINIFFSGDDSRINSTHFQKTEFPRSNICLVDFANPKGSMRCYIYLKSHCANFTWETSVVFSDWYEENSIILSEEGSVIAGMLVGINVIDCNFDFKRIDLDAQVCNFWRSSSIFIEVFFSFLFGTHLFRAIFPLVLTSFMSFWCLCCKFWTDFIHCFCVFIVDFEQINGLFASILWQMLWNTRNAVE